MIWLSTSLSAPLVELDLVVLAIGQDRELSLGHLLLDLRQISLGQGEDHRDRLELRHHDQAVGIGRMNDVADIELLDSGHAVDRGGDARVAELHLCALDDGLVRLDGGSELIHLGLLRVDQLRRGEALRQERQVALKIGLCVGELRLIAIAVRGRLVELRLVGAWVDLRQKIARMHGLALGEGDLGKLSLDLAANDHRVVGLNEANAAEINRHVTALHRRSDHRHGGGRSGGWRGGTSAGAPRERNNAARRQSGDHDKT
jgi:hypothetical protein